MKLARKAVVQDAEAIARIHVLAWQRAYRDIVPDDVLDALSIPKRTEFWRSRLATDAAQVLVIEAESGLIGFTDFGPPHDDPASTTIAEIYAIYIAPGHWGIGCGSMLLGEVERLLIAARFSNIILWVLPENRRGRSFYEHHGFSADGASKEMPFSGAMLSAVRYAKNIAPAGV